jgi:hypothetical protein
VSDAADGRGTFGAATDGEGVVSAYISRGVLHEGGPVDLLASWSEKDKDAAAELLLGVVKVSVDEHREWVGKSQEPTGLGHLAPDMAAYVYKRSA